MRFSSTRVLIVSLISLLLPSVVTTVKVTHKGFFSDLFGGFWRSSKQSTRDAVVRDVEDVQDGIKDTGAALKNTGAALLRHGRRTATGAARSFGRALKDGWSSILSKGDVPKLKGSLQETALAENSVVAVNSSHYVTLGNSL
ncbi:hypothetical protein FOL46_002029 [Perkinsus olseni]|uniref:Uncharacterized protein n=1 Tax=Perkinsus olseni TaxID=32597 RepID=A0A7J6M9W0_PEROL|nr:hypothetical protein FOL46_002029 [Perkinsus olseni]